MATELVEKVMGMFGGKTGRLTLAAIDGIINAALLEKSEAAFLVKTVGVVALKALGFDAIPDAVADADAGCLGMKVYLWIKNLMSK